MLLLHAIRLTIYRAIHLKKRQVILSSRHSSRDHGLCMLRESLPAHLSWFGALQKVDAYSLLRGYPELHVKEINENTAMQAALQSAVNAHKPILTECGGMMALAEAINDTPVFGLLAGHCQIKKCFQGLVTQHVSLAQVEVAAHTFHYGSFTTPLAIAFQATSKNGNGEAAYQHGSITASFLHFYFASNPQVTARLFLAKGLGMRFFDP